MSDYAKARINMVECQLRTNGITAPDILDCFSTVPREAFLTGDLKKNAYVDDDLPLPGAGFLMEPLVFAHMVEAAAPAPGDTVLNIGDVTGYSSAILSLMVNKVVALEAKPGALRAAQAQWSALGYGNIVTAAAAQGPFSLIIINGAVNAAPDNLLAQLANGGRLVAVVRPQGRKAGAVTVIEKDGAGIYSRRALSDATVPYLPGFEPPPGFKF
jgi:protein-L-isoaspartate(D-aspartate) O-methyltransferase